MRFDLKDFRNRSIGEYLKEKEHLGEKDHPELLEFLYSLVALFKYDETGEPLWKLVQQDWSLFTSHDSCGRLLDTIILSDPATFARDGIENAGAPVIYKDSITDCVDVWEKLKEVFFN